MKLIQLLEQYNERAVYALYNALKEISQNYNKYTPDEIKYTADNAMKQFTILSLIKNK